MEATLEVIRETALSLPIAERKILASEILASVPRENEETSSLDSILIERSKGPFIPWDIDDDSFWQEIEDTALAEIAQEQRE